MLPVLVESALRSFLLGLLLWIALKALRVKEAQAQWNVWTGVLLAALCMPLLMQWTTLQISLPEAPALKLHLLSVYPRSLFIAGYAPVQHLEQRSGSWIGVLGGVYLVVAGVLLLRLLIGLALSVRLRRTARAVPESWMGNRGVRVSASVRIPVTVGRTIILPPAYVNWSAMKLEAVLSHEGSHAQRGDFFVLLLAGMNRGIFWFSPFSWWLWAHLARLAEAASDDAAIVSVKDRSGYAEILLEFARTTRFLPAGIPIVRPGMVKERIERILEGRDISTGKRSRLQLYCMVPFVVVAIAVCAGFSWSSLTPKLRESTQTQSAAGQQSAAPVPSPYAKRTNAAEATRQTLAARIDTGKGPYVIVDGESLTINGSETKVIMGGNSITVDKIKSQRVQEDQPAKGAGDRIWFKQDGNSYTISDPGTVERAKGLFRTVEQLGRKQGVLGSRQGALGAQQGRLGRKQAEYGRDPDADSAAAQTRLGELQSALGEQQSRLGEEQSQLAEDQTRAAEHAIKELRSIIMNSLQNGLATPSH